MARYDSGRGIEGFLSLSKPCWRVDTEVEQSWALCSVAAWWSQCHGDAESSRFSFCVFSWWISEELVALARTAVVGVLLENCGSGLPENTNYVTFIFHPSDPIAYQASVLLHEFRTLLSCKNAMLASELCQNGHLGRLQRENAFGPLRSLFLCEILWSYLAKKAEVSSDVVMNHSHFEHGDWPWMWNEWCSLEVLWVFLFVTKIRSGKYGSYPPILSAVSFPFLILVLKFCASYFSYKKLFSAKT